MRAAAQGILDTVLPASQGFNPDYQPGQSSSGKLFDANVLQNIKKKKKVYPAENIIDWLL